MKKILGIAAIILFVAGGLYAWLGGDPGSLTSPPNPAIGQITSVTAENISIETSGGAEYQFVNRAEGVSVAHLEEHQADKEPVSITWRAEGGKRIATHIEDLP